MLIGDIKKIKTLLRSKNHFTHLTTTHSDLLEGLALL